jgi:formylglycine-generating enzyme required for sulfatase activity
MKMLKLALAMSLISVAAAQAQNAPVITSFSRNGELVCDNLMAGSVAAVEWASSPQGPWTNSWAGLTAVVADSNGVIRASVPMFYRVRGIPAPVDMALIHAGPFVMGDPMDGDSGALPLHTNQISAFYMDRHEVSKALWDEVYHWALTNGYSFEHPGSGKAPTHPVQTVSWYDCVKWCNARSEKELRTPAYYTDAGQTVVYRAGVVVLQSNCVKWTAGYRLPTEAEWEKAARGGAARHRFPWVDTDEITHSRANYISSALPQYGGLYDTSPTRGYHPTFATGTFPYTSPVGYFAPNGYGLYDMAGNVFEWCWDWLGSYPAESQTDPRGPASGTGRVVRGSTWSSYACRCRVADRTSGNPTYGGNELGFRSVLPVGP